MKEASITSQLRYPASAAQRGIWLAVRMRPESYAYNVPHLIRFSKALDAAALIRSFAAVVARHEALRTRFESIDGNVVAVVSAALEVSMPIVQLQGDSPAAIASHERECIDAFARITFDLELGPLIRATLLRVPDVGFVLAIVVHHIVFDRWSLGVFAKDLADFYGAARAGALGTLAPLKATYADFVRAEESGGLAADRDLAYWRETGVAEVEPLELPTDHPRPRTSSHRGAVYELTLDADLSKRIADVAIAHGATKFMTYLSAFCVLLQRYSGQDDFVVGTPVAGRTRAEYESLVGLFVNVMPLRVRPDSDRAFAHLLATIKASIAALLSHQAVPLERLAREMLDGRDSSRSPLFDVSFNFYNVPYAPVWPEELCAEAQHVNIGVARLDLMLVMRPKAGGSWTCCFDYASDLFLPETIERMAAHFRVLLEAIARAPDTPIGELPLLSSCERERILGEWSASKPSSGLARPFDRDAMLHTLFEREARRRPEAIALREDGGSALSYAEVERRANRLAHALRARGVGRDVPVGIFVERSAGAIVAMLATLKAGGAYVPLDPNYPPERTRYMLEASGARIVVAAQTHRAAASDFAVSVLTLEGESEYGAYPPLAPRFEASPDDLAYVMFTSGSTGKPKGVAIAHRNVVALVTGTEHLALSEDDVAFGCGSLGFDTSTFEIWGALACGAKLIVAPPQNMSIAEFGGALVRHGVTHLLLSPEFFFQLVDERLDDLRGLRFLSVGGDVLSPAYAARFANAVPTCRFYNGYGPTECTVWATMYRVPPDVCDDRSVSIGRPIASTRTYILDGRGEPVPAGVPGELCVGGDGLARGYINDTALTAQRFHVDPFVPGSHARLYRTGDRARWLADGTIDFLGRRDAQVKIRGFRIEPAEIEFALIDHPFVRRAAVTTKYSADAAGRILVAYVESCDPGLDENALRSYLRMKLPPHAIPSRLVVLDAIPLTSSGKIDRAHLPDVPETAVPPTADAPLSDVERTVATILEKILERPAFGRRDDFFSLGGHSLLATRAISRIADSFGIELSLRAFFAAPTVAGLAALIEHGGHEAHVPVTSGSLTAVAIGALSDSEVDAMLLRLLDDGLPRTPDQV